MGNLAWLLTGGFLKGYRTYVLMGVLIVTALANYAVGDADAMSTVQAILIAFGINTVRASIPPAPPAA